MPDPSREPESREHRTPRWVKAFAIIGIVLALLVVIVLLVGGGLGGHGPGRHLPGRDGGDAAPGSLTEDGRHTLPRGILVAAAKRP